MTLARLESALDKAESYAIDAGAMKARDPKEPGVQRKLRMESKFRALTKQMFDAQALKVERWMEMKFQPNQLISPWKAENIPTADDEIDATEPEWRAAFYRVYLEAIADGIKLFSTHAKFDLDYAKINPEASRAAQKMSLHFLHDIDNTTKASIREAVRQFVETPGMTLGDVMKQLPFDMDRAERIAITEITRAYAQANINIGAEMKKQFPGVKVVKYWFTNQDDIVCDICGPLDTGKPVPFDKPFNASLGIDSPPAHPNCRCWTQVTTDV